MRFSPAFKSLPFITFAAAAAYFITGSISLLAALPGSPVSPIWIPSGTALGLLLLAGYRTAPGIFLGSLALNWLNLWGQGLIPAGLAAFFIAAGSTIQACTALFFLRLAAQEFSFSRVRDSFVFSAVAFFSCIIAPSFGVVGLLKTGLIPYHLYSLSWWTWWLGDLTGILLITPLIVVWRRNINHAWEPQRFFEGVAFSLLFFIILYLVFSDATTFLGAARYVLTYLLIPFILWACFRFGERGVTLLIVASDAIAIMGTLNGYGPFASGKSTEDLLLLQAFVAGIGLTALILSAALKELKGARDIQQRHREHLDMALEAGRMGTWDWDIPRGTVKWSTGLEKLHGLAPGTFGGRFEDFRQDIHPDDAGKVQEAVEKALRDKSTYEVEYRIIRPDGTTTWVEARGRTFFTSDGQPERMAGICMDVSFRKDAEENIRRYSHELEARNRELKHTNKELEQFAYVASHDLQEPLRTLSSFAELFEAQYSGQLTGEAEDFLKIMMKSSQKAQLLVQDLLAYARAGSAKKVERFYSGDILNQVLFSLNESIRQSGALVTADSLPEITADKTQMTQLFLNLIGNAVKFRKAGEPPRVHVSARRGKSEWIFTVKDNGIGIEQQYLDRIFIIFQRLHGDSQYPGTGVGLALCKKIADSLGGSIWVDSRVGEGSSFHFSIPD